MWAAICEEEHCVTTLKTSGGQNTDPQFMDYPKMDATEV